MKQSPRKFIQHLKDRILLSKKTFILYSVLRALVILTAVRCFIDQNFESFALCLLSLVLFLLPAFFEEKLKVDIPPLFESMIYLFIYAAEILGEVNRYYTEIPGWDTMLHTINGFLCAAIGFSLVDVLNRKSKNLNLSPIYLAVVAFCFSMTIGVIWEFFEFTMDHFFYLDMQKDYIIHDIGSVTLDPTHTQTPFQIHHITRTIIETASGKNYVVEGGYLDVGINDTMKDLFVNFIGAIVFSIIGYFYEKKKQNKEKENAATAIAGGLKLSVLTDEQMAEQEEEINKRKAALEEERRRRIPIKKKNKNKETRESS